MRSKSSWLSKIVCGFSSSGKLQLSGSSDSCICANAKDTQHRKHERRNFLIRFVIIELNIQINILFYNLQYLNIKLSKKKLLLTVNLKMSIIGLTVPKNY